MLALACIWSLIPIFHLFLLISLPFNNNKKNSFSSSPPLTSAPQLKEIVGRLSLSQDRDWVTPFVVCVYLGGLSLHTILANQAAQRMVCSGKGGHNLVGLRPTWSSQGYCCSLKAWRIFLFELAVPGSAAACGDLVTAEVWNLWALLPGSVQSGAGLDCANISAMRQLETCNFSSVLIALTRVVKWFILLKIQLVWSAEQFERESAW